MYHVKVTLHLPENAVTDQLYQSYQSVLRAKDELSCAQRNFREASARAIQVPATASQMWRTADQLVDDARVLNSERTA